MPTYVYRREDGTTFEVFQRITDAPLTEDPETGRPVERVISGGAGLQFKGSGFYLTDYARKDNGASETTEKNTTNAEATSSAAAPKETAPKKTESKADVKND